jgi:hypothetical protein
MLISFNSSNEDLPNIKNVLILPLLETWARDQTPAISYFERSIAGEVVSTAEDGTFLLEGK